MRLCIDVCRIMSSNALGAGCRATSHVFVDAHGGNADEVQRERELGQRAMRCQSWVPRALDPNGKHKTIHAWMHMHLPSLRLGSHVQLMIHRLWHMIYKSVIKNAHPMLFSRWPIRHLVQVRLITKAERILINNCIQSIERDKKDKSFTCYDSLLEHLNEWRCVHRTGQAKSIMSTSRCNHLRDEIESCIRGSHFHFPSGILPVFSNV